MNKLLYPLATVMFFLSHMVGASKADELRVLANELQRDAFYFDGKIAKGELGKWFQCALSVAGYSEKVDVMPFQRANLLISQGAGDVIFPMIQSAAREKSFVATKPVVTSKPALLSRNPELTSLYMLKGLRVATVRNSIFHDVLLTIGAEVFPVAMYNQGILMVANNHVDAAVIPFDLLDETQLAPEVGFHVAHLPALDVVFYVSKKSKQQSQIVNNLNRAIQSCQKAE